MSIINNVLRDLESKPSSFTPLDTLSIDVTRQHEKATLSSIRIAGFVLLGALIFSFAIINMDWIAANLKQVEEPRPVIVEDKAPALANLPAPVIERLKSLRGLQFNEEPDFMSLEFELQDQSQIYLSERSGNAYTFHLSKTRSDIQAPLLGQNPWLAQLDLNNAEEGLDIYFKARDGVMVETSSLTKEGQFYWVVKLKKIKIKEAEPKLVVAETTAEKPIVSRVTASVAGSEQEQPVEPVVSRPQKLEIKSVPAQTTELNRLNTAMNSFKAGDWDNAENQLKGLLEGKYDRQARLHLAQLFKQRQKQSQLGKLLTQSRRKYTNDADFDLLHANHLFANKQYAALISQFVSKANNENILNLVAASYQRSGQHSKAIQQYMNVIRLNPNQPKLWVSLGISQQAEGQNKEALNSFKTALASGSLNDRLKVFLQQRIRLLSGHRG